MNAKIKLLSLCGVMVALAGCYSTGAERIKLTEMEPIAYNKSIEEGRSSIVVYREADAISGNAVNVYINGEYLASLKPNAYSQETVCAANQRLYAQFTGDDPAYNQKAKAGDVVNLNVNQVNFFKVINVDNRPSLKAVSAEQAEKELIGIMQQKHTLKRVDHLKNCEKVLSQYNLSAGALFKFNGHSYGAMLSEGKNEIQAIAKDIQKQNYKVSSIKVVGHTDPEGQASYNLRLSKQRAETVKQALVKNGINKQLVLTEGKGSQELVVGNCRTQFPGNVSARQDCDQPNRRVEVVVYGDK